MNLQLQPDVYQVMELAYSEYSYRFRRLFHRRLLSYSSFYAAIGAAVDNQTDSQQFFITYYYAAGFECLCWF
jgi:hypothetical protein